MLTAIYVEVDDFCKSSSAIISNFGVVRRGPAPKLTLSEIMTILIYYHEKNYKNFKSYYTEYVMTELYGDFPDLVSYNRFIEFAPRAMMPLALFLAHQCESSRKTGIYYIDSTRWAACHPKRAHNHKVMKGFAAWGKSSIGWFYGMKYHLVVNQYGEIMNFYLSPGNVSDANAKVMFQLTKDLFGWLFGDRGYLINPAKRDLLERDGELLVFAKCRKNMKKQSIPVEAELWLKKRGIVESVIKSTKCDCDATHTRSRNPFNAFTNLFAALVAYSFKPNKPATAIKLERRLLQMPINQDVIAA